VATTAQINTQQRSSLPNSRLQKQRLRIRALATVSDDADDINNNLTDHP